MLLSHLVTARCPCRCPTCLWRGLTAARDELGLAEIEEVYREAYAGGVRLLAVWGGEPLVREDLPAILRSARHTGLLATLITSGWRFDERFAELVPVLGGVIFSLDHVGNKHDAMRGMPGLFDAVCVAIDRLRDESPATQTYINTVVSRMNADAVPELVRLAGRHRVPIWINPMETGMLGQTGSASAKSDLALADGELSDLARELIVLKGRGYPIANSYTFLRGFVGGKQPYRCHARKMCLELRPNGDLMDCLDRFRPVANVRTEPLSDFLARPDIRRSRLAKVDCTFCNTANVIDTSHVWEARPETIWSLVQRQSRLGLR